MDCKPTYRVRDWDARFEKAGSRKVLKRLSWVAIPNNHDGPDYRRVIAREGGVELFGTWMLLVQVASRMPRRGVLANENGPLDAEDLALMTGAPLEIFKKALPIFTEPRIGWLEIVSESDESGSKSPSATSKHPNAGSTLPETPQKVATHYITRPDPTRQNKQNTTRPDSARPHRTDPTGPSEVESESSQSGFSGPDRTGSDRNGSDVANAAWGNQFVLDIVLALGFGLDEKRAMANRKPFMAVARRLFSRSDREAVREDLVVLAKGKAGEGLDNPAAAWQKEVDQRYPKNGKRVSNTGDRGRTKRC